VSFLTIYGIEVGGADGNVAITDESLQSRSRAVDGSAIGSRSADLVGFDVKTSIESAAVGKALRGLLRSRGDRWGFDFTNDGVVDGTPEYSAKGLYPSNTPAYRTRGEQGTETIAQSTSDTATVPKLGDGCLEIGPAVTNLFAQNVANGNESGGLDANFTAVGGASTPTVSSAAAWQGTKSVLVVCAGLGQGLQANKGSGLSAATAYCGSVYLKKKTGTGTDVKVYLQETAGGSAAGTSKTVRLTTTGWTRVEVGITTGGGVSGVGLVVEQATSSGLEFYADGFQLEARSFANTWTEPPTSTSAGDLRYRLGEQRSADDLTVMCWVRAPAGPSAPRHVFQIGPATECLKLWYDQAGSTTWDASVVTAGSTYSATVGAFPSNSWKHVAIVMRRNPETGLAKLMAYVDGAEVATLSPGSLPAFSAPTLYVGNDDTASYPLCGLIDELVVLPFALTEEMIAAVYTRALSAWPDLLVGGDLVAGADTDDEIRMVGEVGGDRLVQASIDGSWSNRARELSFKLVQVSE
jgi:hypothetical protein